MLESTDEIWAQLLDEPAWKDLIGHPDWWLEDPRTTNYTLRHPDYPVDKLAWTIGSHLVSAYRSKGEMVDRGRIRVPNPPGRRSAEQLEKLVLARYLLGVPLEQYAEELDEHRRFMQPLISGMGIECKPWLGAIALLLGKDEVLDWALSAVHNFLFDSYRRLNPISRRPVWEGIHGGLLEAIDLQLAGQHQQASDRVFNYVDHEWYDEHHEFIWWHNTYDTAGWFYGYWCFEVAAIAQIYGIDDTRLHGHRHYPTDLVDYYRQNVAAN